MVIRTGDQRSAAVIGAPSYPLPPRAPRDPTNNPLMLYDYSHSTTGPAGTARSLARVTTKGERLMRAPSKLLTSRRHVPKPPFAVRY
jgi:hypothetical protein